MKSFKYEKFKHTDSYVNPDKLAVELEEAYQAQILFQAPSDQD